MRNDFVLFAAAAATLAAGSVSAQDAGSGPFTSSFRGFRIEGQAGGDRFQSEGDHRDKFGYGGAAGFDGMIGNRIVVGPEVGYWRGRGTNTTGGAFGGDTVARKSLEEWTAGVRGGYLVQPKLLVYGIGGYARAEERLAYSGVNGQGGFSRRDNADGWFAGGGAEYSLTDLVYVGAGYRYANYDNHTARQRLFGSVGVRFK